MWLYSHIGYPLKGGGGGGGGYPKVLLQEMHRLRKAYTIEFHLQKSHTRYLATGPGPVATDIEKSWSGHNLPNFNILRINPFFCGRYDVYKQLKTNNNFCQFWKKSL